MMLYLLKSELKKVLAYRFIAILLFLLLLFNVVMVWRTEYPEDKYGPYVSAMLDAYAADPERSAYRGEWLRELESVSHREYCTGYYLDDCRRENNLASSVGYIREKAYFSIALEYDDAMLPEGLIAKTEQGSLARFKQKNKICVGDRAELLTPGKIGRPFIVQEMYSEDGERIEAAPHPSQTVYIRVPYDVREGDILRAGEEQI